MRLYRELEGAGVGDAYELAILNSAIAAQLWLPLVLIEISWRNLVDRILIDEHPAAEWWFLDSSPAPGSETFGADSLIAGPRWLQGRADDPILAAARAFQRHVRASQMRRDDMVAHLTFGFWALGVPARALELDPPIDIYQAAARRLDSDLDPIKLRARMNEMVDLRNRIAHHEPIVLRGRAVFARDGEPQPPLAILRNASQGFETFEQRVDRIRELAAVLAPRATADVEKIPPAIRALLRPVGELIEQSRARLEAERDRRKAH